MKPSVAAELRNWVEHIGHALPDDRLDRRLICEWLEGLALRLELAEGPTWTVCKVREGRPLYAPENDPPVYYPQELEVDGDWSLLPGDELVKREGGVDVS